MKKKSMMIAAAASVFVSAAPLLSHAADNVITVVDQAVMQMQKAYHTYSDITVIGQFADITAVYKEYNAAKAAYTNTKAIVVRKGGTQKDVYLAKLDDNYTKYITNRVIPYIDAYNYAVQNLEANKNSLQDAIEAKDLDAVQKFYHEISYQLKVRTVILDRVFSENARNLLRSKFKREAQDLRDSMQYDVTVVMKIKELYNAIAVGKEYAANKAVEQINLYLPKVSETFKPELTTKAAVALVEYEKALQTTPVNNGSLTIEDDSQPNKIINGSAKTYTVTLKHPVHGTPIEGAILNVIFKENLETDFNSQNKVYVTNSDNKAVIPYQSIDGQQQAATIQTEKNGKATFTLTGVNATVTPIVFLDGSNQAWNTNGGELPNLQNDRFEQGIEISTFAEPLTFTMADYKITVDGIRTNFAAIAVDHDHNLSIEGDEHNGRDYIITVTKPDGTLFAGGKVNVGIEALVDKNLENSQTKSYLVGLGEQGVLTLDSKGQATVTLSSTAINDSAKPIVWIDQNFANNAQNDNVLQEGEPVSDQLIVEPVNFQPERVDNGTLGAKLTHVDLTEEARTHYSSVFENVVFVSGLKFTVLNQSGKPFLPHGGTDNKEARVTYTIVNTGTHKVKVHTTQLFSEPTLKNAVGAGVSANGSVEIEVGGRVTIAGDIVEPFDNEVDSINSCVIAVYSIGGNSSVEVTASAVVDRLSESESQSVAVHAGPLKVDLYDRLLGETVVKAASARDFDHNGKADQVILTFTKPIFHYEASDFRIDQENGTYANPSHIQQEGPSTLVLHFSEEALATKASPVLKYDPNYGGTKELQDEFGTKITSFSINY